MSAFALRSRLTSSIAVLVAIVVAACSSSDGGSGTGSGGAGGNGTTSGASTSSSSTSTSTSGSASGSTSTGTGSTGTGGMDIVVDDTGKAALAGGEGITGDVAGKGVFTYTEINPTSHSDGILFIGARMGQGEWNISMPDVPGTYDCGTGGMAGKVQISISDPMSGVVLGTTAPAGGGSCLLRLDSVTPHIEGAFAGTIFGFAVGTAKVSSGYFHIDKGI